MAQPSYDAVPAHSPGPAQETFNATDVNPQPPQPPFLAAEGGSPRVSSYQGTQNDSHSLLAGKHEPDSADSEGGVVATPERKKRNPIVLALIALVVLIVVVLAVVLPVYFTVIKKNNNESASSTGAGSTTSRGTGTATAAPVPSATPTPTRPTTGGDGSTVTATNGTTFTYVNRFGGICELILNFFLRCLACFTHRLCTRLEGWCTCYI